MSRELLILRNAEAASDTGSLNDFDRPLTPYGVMSCYETASILVKQDIRPDTVLCSNAVRSTQTILRICKQAAIPNLFVNWHPELYNSQKESILNLIRGCDETTDRLMIVGHNPSLKHFLNLICVPPVPVSTQSKSFPSGALIRMRILVPWEEVGEHCATFVSLNQPKTNIPVFENVT